ncbi:hypothetical protein HY990_05355 [Candidatus Micrarchaeota archaeon]|nr:hypothetical protein [Candidatus Micrarchaeota archaeon]
MTIKLYQNPIKIELNDYKMRVNGNMHEHVSTRKVRDMEELLYEPETDAEKILYYMYRGVYQKSEIRYDITILKPEAKARENTKTHGHYHPKNAAGWEYPEVYQVLDGEAVFLFQKSGPKGYEVAVVDAKKGDAIIIPPGYGHVSINAGKKDLILANLVSPEFQSDYSEYVNKKGGAIYYLCGEIIENPNYKIENIERLNSRNWNQRYEFKSTDILAEIATDPKKFEFLKKPESRSWAVKK